MKNLARKTFDSFSCIILYVLVVCGYFSSTAQFYNPNPCQQKGISCANEDARKELVYSFGNSTFEYVSVGTSSPFWIAIGDASNGLLDSTYSGTVLAKLLSGPGILKGTISSHIWGYAYFNDWMFTEPGEYEVEISVSGFITDTILFNVPEKIDLCAFAPKGCNSSAGDAVFPLSGNGGIIPVDAIFPITIGVYDRLTGFVDSTFQNYAHVDKISGPGNLYGSLSMYGTGWLTFTNIRFDQVGVYDLKLSASGNIIPDTVTVHVVGSNSTREIAQNKLKVFPNPADNEVTIAVEGKGHIKALRILNMQGKVIQYFDGLNTTSIQVSDLSAGVYFYEVALRNSDERTKGVLIKK